MGRHSTVADTAPDAFAVYVALITALSPADRAARTRGLTLTVNTLALAGLRMRHPAATEQELLLRLAALRLGDDLVERVYGWRAPADGT
jgi:hypothetical protein